MKTIIKYQEIICFFCCTVIYHFFFQIQFDFLSENEKFIYFIRAVNLKLFNRTYDTNLSEFFFYIIPGIVFFNSLLILLVSLALKKYYEKLKYLWYYSIFVFVSAAVTYISRFFIPYNISLLF